MARQAKIKVIAVSEAKAEGGLRKSHLDSPVTGSELDSGAVKIVGWAVGDKERVASVEVVAGGEVVATAPVEIERPGVAEAYPKSPGSERAGFRVIVQGSGGGGRHDLSVRGVLDGGGRAPIGDIALEIGRRGLLGRLARER